MSERFRIEYSSNDTSRIECLNVELEHSRQLIEEANARVGVHRDEQDIHTIQTQVQTNAKK